MIKSPPFYLDKIRTHAVQKCFQLRSNKIKFTFKSRKKCLKFSPPGGAPKERTKEIYELRLNGTSREEIRVMCRRRRSCCRCRRSCCRCRCVWLT